MNYTDPNPKPPERSCHGLPGDGLPRESSSTFTPFTIKQELDALNNPRPTSPMFSPHTPPFATSYRSSPPTATSYRSSPPTLVGDDTLPHGITSTSIRGRVTQGSLRCEQYIPHLARSILTVHSYS